MTNNYDADYYKDGDDNDVGQKTCLGEKGRTKQIFFCAVVIGMCNLEQQQTSTTKLSHILCIIKYVHTYIKNEEKKFKKKKIIKKKQIKKKQTQFLWVCLSIQFDEKKKQKQVNKKKISTKKYFYDTAKMAKKKKHQEKNFINFS